MRALFLVAPFALSACALVSGLSDVKVCDNCDGGIVAEAASEGSSSCPQACGAAPAGWQAVVMPSDSTQPCGALVGTDWVSGLAPNATPCPCACAVTQPVCTAKDLSIKTGDQCLGMLVIQTNNCAAMSGLVSSAYAVTPIAPTGGGCGAPSTAPTIGAKLGARTCAMPTGCAGAPCPAAGEKACIVHTGALACPSDYSVSTVVGSDITASCACQSNSCSFAATCDNPGLHIYSDAMCGTEIGQVVADGVCHASGATFGKSYGSYKYSATPNGACHNAIPGTATVDLAGKSTLCCKP